MRMHCFSEEFALSSASLDAVKASPQLVSAAPVRQSFDSTD